MPTWEPIVAWGVTALGMIGALFASGGSPGLRLAGPPDTELVERLVEYIRFKEASDALAIRHDQRLERFTRGTASDVETERLPHRKIILHAEVSAERGGNFRRMPEIHRRAVGRLAVQRGENAFFGSHALKCVT